MIRKCIALAPLCLLAACATQPSDRALLESLSQRANQVPSVWRGATDNRIVTADSTWVGGPNSLAYYDSPNTRTFYYLLTRADQDPRFALPGLASNDPEVVLTALYLINIWHPYVANSSANAASAQIADALRQRCFSSPDVRVRWMADRMLFENYQSAITVADFDAVMSDPDQSIRDMCPVFAYAVINNMPAHDPAAYRAQKSVFVDVLIKHLADDDWVVRQHAMGRLRNGLLSDHGPDHDRWHAATQDLPRPNGVVYAQADWNTRQTTQKAWQDWWQSHRDALLASN